jgi:hypothetical protein
MKKALRLALGLSLLCSTGLFAATVLATAAPDKVLAPAAIEAAPMADPQANDSPMLKTVFDRKKNNVDSADCIISCRATYRVCRNGCPSGDYDCYQDCWANWQDCKSGCSFDPPDECWPDPYPCGPCPIGAPNCP